MKALTEDGSGSVDDDDEAMDYTVSQFLMTTCPPCCSFELYEVNASRLMSECYEYLYFSLNSSLPHSGRVRCQSCG